MPEMGRVENFRGGGGTHTIADLFGVWAPVEGMSVETLKRCRLPNAIVNVQAVLECNFDLTEEIALPYDLFDALRTRHSIDSTAHSAPPHVTAAAS